MNRRELKTSAGAAGFWIAGRQVGFGQEKSPNAKLNIAMIGSGAAAAPTSRASARRTSSPSAT